MKWNDEGEGGDTGSEVHEPEPPRVIPPRIAKQMKPAPVPAPQPAPLPFVSAPVIAAAPATTAQAVPAAPAAPQPQRPMLLGIPLGWWVAAAAGFALWNAYRQRQEQPD